MKYPILSVFLLMFLSGTAIAEEPAETSLKEKCEKLLTLIKTGRSPEIYGAVNFARWKDPKDGLKTLAVELIAELGYQGLAITVDHRWLNPFGEDFETQLAEFRGGAFAPLFLF